MKKIAVAGTGYVGLVAGVCFAEVGHDVTCVDVDEAKVKLMESGVSPIYEDGLEELMKKNNATGRLRYTTDYKAAYKDADGFLNAGIGFGGSCFPKDTKALKFLARQYGYELKTVEACVDVNLRQKTRLFEKAKSRMITFDGLKVAVLGLTFKAGTDDLREAPSAENIKLLLEQGANIYAYDPVGVPRAKMQFPEGKIDKGQMYYVDSPQEALQDAAICFVFTEWGEIKAVTPEVYKKLMRIPLVYDGRNLYTLESMKDAGVEYYSIGR